MFWFKSKGTKICIAGESNKLNIPLHYPTKTVSSADERFMSNSVIINPLGPGVLIKRYIYIYY